MKQLRVSLGLLACLLLMATPAAAKDLGGRFALGGGYTLVGNGGLQVKYFIQHLGMQLLVSYGSLSQEVAVGDKKGDDTITEMDASLRVLYNVARAKETNFYAGVGATFGRFSYTYADGNIEKVAYTQMAFEGIIGVEHFFGNFFSLTFETGLPFHLIEDEGFAIGNLTGSGSSVLPFGRRGGAGSAWHIGGLSPAFASSFNFYF